MAKIDVDTYKTYIELLGQTPDQVTAIKGNPKKQSTEEGSLYYWYGSIAPSQAELYRFADGKVVWVSLDMSDQNFSLDQFVQALGSPAYSIRRYAEKNDSLRNHVAAWPEQGKAVIVNGVDLNASVVRFEFFQPETVQEYLTNFGKDYADKEKVNLLESATSFPQASAIDNQQIQTQPNSVNQFFSQNKTQLSLIIVLLIALVIVTIRALRKSHRNRTPGIGKYK